jgi:replication factor C subunit 1
MTTLIAKLSLKLKLKSQVQSAVITSSQPQTNKITLSVSERKLQPTVIPTHIITSGVGVGETQTTTLWTEKYRPKTLSEFPASCDQLTQIREWFSLRTSGAGAGALLFTGAPGTSKTTIAHLIMAEMGYQVIEINASQLKTKKLIETQLEGFRSCPQTSYGLVIDEVDGMTSGDRGGMSHLINFITTEGAVTGQTKTPIICISNRNYDKKINELKKVCLEIKFYKPSIEHMKLAIQHVMACESPNVKMNDDAIGVIANLAQGDYRRLMFLLQHFAGHRREHAITANDIYNDYDILAKKNPDLNVFESTNRMLSRPQLVEDVMIMYDQERNTLPMMIHQNYTRGGLSMDGLRQVITTICQGDLIEKRMYSEQSWHLQSLHGLASCYLPSYYVNSDTQHGSQPSSQWTDILSKLSSQFTHSKYLNHVGLSVGHHGFNEDTIRVLAELIIFHLCNPNGYFIEGLNMLSKYGLSIDDVDHLSKVITGIKPLNKTQLKALGHKAMMFNFLDGHGHYNDGIRYAQTHKMKIGDIDKIMKSGSMCDEHKKLYLNSIGLRERISSDLCVS